MSSVFSLCSLVRSLGMGCVCGQWTTDGGEAVSRARLTDEKPLSPTSATPIALNSPLSSRLLGPWPQGSPDRQTDRQSDRGLFNSRFGFLAALSWKIIGNNPFLFVRQREQPAPRGERGPDIPFCVSRSDFRVCGGWPPVQPDKGAPVVRARHTRVPGFFS